MPNNIKGAKDTNRVIAMIFLCRFVYNRFFIESNEFAVIFRLCKVYKKTDISMFTYASVKGKKLTLYKIANGANIPQIPCQENTFLRGY